MRKVIIGDNKWEKVQEIELKEVNYGGKDMRWHVGDVEFDGHHTLWGFEYFPTTYLKQSELSGDEYRKGGVIRYYRDRKQCFEEFCREPTIAALKIGETLLKLMDFGWDRLEVGRKVYFEQTPAVVDMIIENQGCVVLKTEDGKNFPDSAWEKEEGLDTDDKQTIKIEVLSDKIWWWRK